MFESWRGFSGVGVQDVSEGVALDEAGFLAGGETQGVGGDAIDFSHGTSGGFVKHGEGVGGKDLSFASGAGEANAYVLCSVFRGEGTDGHAVVNAGYQRPIAAQGEAVGELG